MAKELSTNQLGQYLAFAGELARQAGQVTLKYFGRRLDVEQKSDLSPVTIADRETEQFIRAAIGRVYPDHGILGEEFGEENPVGPLRWIIDPIDGTQAFIHGVPLYSVLLALEVEGDSCLGVIHNPPMDETVCAAAGLGCAHNGNPCRVSRTSELAGARVHATDCADLMRRRPGFCAALLNKASCFRTWGDAYGYLMVATGRADAMIDPIVSLWDVAPLKPIIEEAGGRFTDLAGLSSIHVGHALATNGALHDQVLELARLDAAED